MSSPKVTIALKGANRTTFDTPVKKSVQPFNFTKGVDIDLSPAMAADGGIWSPVASPDIAQTSTEKTIGGTSIRLHNASGQGGLIADFDPVIQMPNGEDDLLTFWFYCDFAPASGVTQQVRVFIYNPVSEVDPTPTSNGLVIDTNMQAGFKTGWNCIRLPRTGRTGSNPGLRNGIAGNSGMTAWTTLSGGFNPSLGIARIRLYVADTTSLSTYPFYFCGLTVGYRQPPCVMIEFDDGHDDIYTQNCSAAVDGQIISSFTRAQQLGIPLGVGLIRDAINQPNYLTSAQISEMAGAGMEFITHGSDQIRAIANGGVFSTPELGVNDGYETGTFVEGDSIRYNRRWLEDNGFSSTAGGYVFPLNDNRGSGEDWQKDIVSEASDYMDYLASNAPGHNTFDILPIIGEQRFGWGSMGRMTPEDINVIPTYANLINNTIDEGCVAQSQPLWLYFHKLLPGGTQTAPPGVSTEYYVDDFHNLLIYLAAQRDAGVLEIMTTATFYERMVASGVPGGLGFDS